MIDRPRAAPGSQPADARIAAAVRGPVEILRDRAGIPHVYAASTTDLYFGVGFAMAQDRLWQMDRLRRRALGRQAEVLGGVYVKSDLTHHLVGVPEIAAAEVERADGPTRQLLEAFVAGINRQIEAAGRFLPVEFSLLGYEPEPFTPRDVIAILRGMWWSLNGRLENLVAAGAARLLPDGALREAYLTPEAPEERIVPDGAPYPSPVAGGLDAGWAGSGDATGSNNWAVAGTHTASGKALLCSDPHQGFWLPSSWYEYAVHGPEDDAAGAGHPGVPGLWWGSNGDCAWGLTNNAASTRDLYAEEVHPDDPRRYRTGTTWRAFDERQVEIAVRGEVARTFTLRSTVRGPVMNEVLPALAEGGDSPLSLRWVGQEHLDDVRALIALGRARDWPSFRAALRDWSVPVFNFGYADRTGSVGYQCAGRIPLRGRVARGFRDASNQDDVWRGYVPFDALPTLENPPRGYVASANNRVAPDDYPVCFYGAWAAGHRANRIKQVLERGRPIDRAQVIALQNDVISARAARLCPPLLDRLAISDDPDVRLLYNTLSSWDYGYTLESSAPVLFEAFMRRWQARVAAERFPARLLSLVQAQGSAAARLIESEGLAWFEGGPSAVQQALIETAAAAVSEVRGSYGADPEQWRWGTIHHAHWRHPLSAPDTAATLDVGPAVVDGGSDTVRNTGTSPAYAASSGAEYRLVVDFAEPDRFWAVQNVGNSGDPASSHYADQFDAWRAGHYHVVHLRRPDVESDVEGKTLLLPG